MKGNRFTRGAAFSLIEVTAATAVLAVAVVGISGYRYYAALDARKAAMEASASRIGLLLCESWRGVNGDDSYDPVSSLDSSLKITKGSQKIEETISDFNLLGTYQLVLNDTDYSASLWWRDVAPGLRALHVSVSWAQVGQGGPDGNHVRELFRATTYAAN